MQGQPGSREAGDWGLGGPLMVLCCAPYRERHKSREFPFAQRSGPKAEADPNRLLAVPAFKAGARFREESLRGGSRKEAAGAQPQPYGNSGECGPSLGYPRQTQALSAQHTH